MNTNNNRTHGAVLRLELLLLLLRPVDISRNGFQHVPGLDCEPVVNGKRESEVKLWKSHSFDVFPVSSSRVGALLGEAVLSCPDVLPGVRFGVKQLKAVVSSSSALDEQSRHPYSNGTKHAALLIAKRGNKSRSSRSAH